MKGMAEEEDQRRGSDDRNCSENGRDNELFAINLFLIFFFLFFSIFCTDRCFSTGWPAGTINFGRTGRCSTKLTSLLFTNSLTSLDQIVDRELACLVRLF